jgi:hypothetical protein
MRLRAGELRFTLATLLTVLPLAVGCGSASVNVLERYTGTALPAPEFIEIHAFSSTPEEAKLNEGTDAVRADLFVSSDSEKNVSIADARAVARHLRDKLRVQIEDMRIPVRVAEGPMRPSERAISITGQLEQVNDGNVFGRVAIGFGVGKTELKTWARVYVTDPGEPPRLLQEMRTEGDSGWKPGIITTLPIGALINGWAVAAAVSGGVAAIGELSLALSGDVERTAKKLGVELRALFRRQGWYVGIP